MVIDDQIAKTKALIVELEALRDTYGICPKLMPREDGKLFIRHLVMGEWRLRYVRKADRYKVLVDFGKFKAIEALHEKVHYLNCIRESIIWVETLAGTM